MADEEERMEEVDRGKRQLKTRDIGHPEKTIFDWFKYCEKWNILPWEYDLKEEIYPGIDLKDGPIKRLLSSWAGNYFSSLYFKKVGVVGHRDMETEDCDLMQCIYKILWERNSKYAYKRKEIDKEKDFDADLMNSFWSPYKESLNNNELYPWMHENISEARYGKNRPEDLEELIYRYFEDGYREVNSKFERFAKLTHTIGNCTLVPFGFNGKGHNDVNFTWSQALGKLVKTDGFSENETNWSEEVKKLVATDKPKKYIEEYFMESYCIKEKKGFRVIEYGYSDKDYLSKVETSISERGQKMVKKLCDKLVVKHPEIKEYDFYEKLPLED